MRLLILILSLGLFPTVTFSQMLFTTYRITYSDGDSLVLMTETLSRKKLDKLYKASNQRSGNKKILAIKDSEGRVFETILYRGSSIMVENLLDAPYALYSPGESTFYLKVNDSVYYHLYKEEIELKNGTVSSFRYKGLLLTLVDGDPELTNKINKLKFTENHIQGIVADINQLKYPEEKVVRRPTGVANSRVYNSIALHGGKVNKHTNVELDIHRVFYNPSLSNSLSWRTGLTLGYHSGEELDGRSFQNYYVSIPGIANLEITNKIITPYFQGGFLLAFVKEEHHGNNFGLGWILGGGLKIKPTENATIRLGAKTSVAGGNLDVGMEYYFPVRKNRKGGS